MKNLYYVLVIFLLGHNARGQARKPACPCPDQELRSQPTMVFDFGKGRKINLCGYRQEDRKDTIFSAFQLYQCERVLDQSDETGTTRFTRRKDTLFMQEISLLPVGRNFELVAMPLTERKFYFKVDFVYDTTYYLPNAPKYTATQINKVLQQYAHLGHNPDSINAVARRLVWAYRSGSTKAEECLQHIKSKFEIYDGAIAEEFESTWALYGGSSNEKGKKN